MFSFTRLLISIIFVFACSSCAKVATTQWRPGYHGINTDESVVIVLDSYSLQDKFIESEGEERSIESCVGSAIRARQKIKIIPAKDFRNIVFPGKMFQEGPCTSETLLVLFNDLDIQRKLAELNLRYVITIKVINFETETKDISNAHGS